MIFFFFNGCRFVENSSEIFENWGGKSLRLKEKENQKQNLSCLSDPPYEASSFTSLFGDIFSPKPSLLPKLRLQFLLSGLFPLRFISHNYARPKYWFFGPLPCSKISWRQAQGCSGKWPGRQSQGHRPQSLFHQPSVVWTYGRNLTSPQCPHL